MTKENLKQLVIGADRAFFSFIDVKPYESFFGNREKILEKITYEELKEKVEKVIPDRRLTDEWFSFLESQEFTITSEESEKFFKRMQEEYFVWKELRKNT